MQKRLRKGQHVKETELVLYACSILALLLCTNWQSPGAVTNMTLEEYQESVIVSEGGNDVRVFNVHDHKTGLQDAARITISGDDITLLQAYHLDMRPYLDKENKSPYFLVLPGGCHISKANYYTFRSWVGHMILRHHLPHNYARSVHPLQRS